MHVIHLISQPLPYLHPSSTKPKNSNIVLWQNALNMGIIEQLKCHCNFLLRSFFLFLHGNASSSHLEIIEMILSCKVLLFLKHPSHLCAQHNTPTCYQLKRIENQWINLFLPSRRADFFSQLQDGVKNTGRNLQWIFFASLSYFSWNITTIFFDGILSLFLYACEHREQIQKRLMHSASVSFTWMGSRYIVASISINFH